MVLLFSVINFDCAFNAAVFSSKMPSFIFVWSILIWNAWNMHHTFLKIRFDIFNLIFAWILLHNLASNMCLYKSIKNLAIQTRFDNFSYQVLFWRNLLLIKHQKLIKNAKLRTHTERQCVITLPMTFNSTWLWKIKFKNLNFDKNCESENDKNYFSFI